MKVLVAGDFCPQHRVAELFEKGSFSQVLEDVKETINSADYSIVNFECPITKGGEKPIEKIGPNLQCGESGMQAVKWVGFNCVTLANNHFLDYGEEGVKNTLETCKKYDIDTVGGGLNIQEASRILYKEIKGQTLAIINCCEHEFSIATEETAGSNPLNPIMQYYAIIEARTKADYVLVIVHGGHEHYQLPSPRMQETYRFFVDAGADAVVNHHQHCYSGYEVYKKKPIFYGLGNLCFDNKGKDNKWNEGILIELVLGKEIEFEPIPYCQCGAMPSIIIKDCDTNRFSERINFLNHIISNSKLLLKCYNEYLDKNDVEHIFEPFTSRVLYGLLRRNLLPSVISKKKKRELLAYIQCESHIVKVLHSLKRQ